MSTSPILSPSFKKKHTAAFVRAESRGFCVFLDSSPLTTPLGIPVVLPSRALADHLSAEWSTSEETLRPDQMPVTRLVMTALDRLGPSGSERTTTEDTLASFLDTDLLCYRASYPQALIAEQKALWDPFVDWAQTVLAAPLITTEGIIPTPQSPKAHARVRDLLPACSSFHLATLHGLATRTGSVLLALALCAHHASTQRVWEAATLEERWNRSQWGEDKEATDIFAHRAREFEKIAACAEALDPLLLPCGEIFPSPPLG